MLATATGPHLYWIASRAAGSAALVLSSVSVSVGLLMGQRLLKGRRPDLRVAHEALSLATLVAIAVHGLTLLGDGFLHPSLADVTVPFVSGYKTFWTTTGIVSFWALLALGLSYYARARIGVQRWRMLHRFTALAWILGIAHSLGEGSDAGELWFLAMAGAVVLPALALLIARLLGSSESGDVERRGRIRATTGAPRGLSNLPG
ncbi:MAG: ferric reductase-like transmembrane domain-containing protein [Solirubrobacteraceae bacterium]